MAVTAVRGPSRSATSGRWTIAAIAVALAVTGCGTAAGSSASSALPSAAGTPLAGLAGRSSASPARLPIETDPPRTPVPPSPVAGIPFGVLGIPDAGAFPGSITCEGPIGATDPVGIVTQDAGGFDFRQVLMDFADPANPRVACTFAGQQLAWVIDARHIVIALAASDALSRYAVVDLPEVRYQWFGIPRTAGGSIGTLLAVSPKLDAIAWNAVTDGGPVDRIHLATASGDTVLATLPDTNVGRCGAPSDSKNADFNAATGALFVLDEPLPEISLIVVKDGRTVLSMPGSATDVAADRPTMALWSTTSETLYWSQGGAIWRWTLATGPTVFLPGVTWDVATISPDGTHLAYHGPSGTFLLDLAAKGTPVPIPSGRPVFLDGTHVLLEQDFAGCAGDGTPPPQVYDLTSAKLTAVPFLSAWSVWPATSTHR